MARKAAGHVRSVTLVLLGAGLSLGWIGMGVQVWGALLLFVAPIIFSVLPETTKLIIRDVFSIAVSYLGGAGGVVTRHIEAWLSAQRAAREAAAAERAAQKAAALEADELPKKASKEGSGNGVSQTAMGKRNSISNGGDAKGKKSAKKR